MCSTINMQNNFKNVTFFLEIFFIFFSWQFRLTFSSMDGETAARLAVRGGLLQAADHEQFKLSVGHNGCKNVRGVGNPVHTLHSDCVVVCQRSCPLGTREHSSRYHRRTGKRCQTCLHAGLEVIDTSPYRLGTNIN